jgi:hypothetical protein
MVETSYDEKNGILTVRSFGTISLEDMLKAMEFLANNDSLARNIKILEDATRAKVSFSVSSIQTITDNLSKVMKKYISVRHAVIHSDPINTAYTFLADDILKGTNYWLKVFSTSAAAREWLEIG